MPYQQRLIYHKTKPTKPRLHKHYQWLLKKNKNLSGSENESADFPVFVIESLEEMLRET